MENIIKDSVKLYNTIVKEVTDITNKIIEQYNESDKTEEPKQADGINKSSQTEESRQTTNYDKDIVDELYNIIYEKNNKIKELEDIIKMKYYMEQQKI
jgi:hypothetical protein